MQNDMEYNYIISLTNAMIKCSFISFNYYTNETILITLALNIIIILNILEIVQTICVLKSTSVLKFDRKSLSTGKVKSNDTREYIMNGI